MVIELSEVQFGLYLIGRARSVIITLVCIRMSVCYPYVTRIHLFGSEILTKTPHGYIRVVCEQRKKMFWLPVANWND